MSKIFNPENHSRLSSEERRKLIPPEKILNLMQLQNGDVLLDAGAGTGYFAVPALNLVGDNGRVIAADLSQPMLDMLVQIAPTAKNLEILLCTADHIPLPEKSADKILMAFVLHEVDDAVAYLKMLRNILKDDGKLFIVEWSPVESPMGPPLHERLSKDVIENCFSESGFEMLRFENVNEFQYFCEAEIQQARDSAFNSREARP